MEWCLKGGSKVEVNPNNMCAKIPINKTISVI